MKIFELIANKHFSTNVRIVFISFSTRCLLSVYSKLFNFGYLNNERFYIDIPVTERQTIAFRGKESAIQCHIIMTTMMMAMMMLKE
jgi:hypothetical protein